MADLKGRSIASSYKNLLQSSSEISSTNLKQIQSGSGNPLAMKLSTDKAVFTKVGIGNTGSVPDGLLHIMSTSAGTVTASSLADEAVLESSGSVIPKFKKRRIVFLRTKNPVSRVATSNIIHI